MKMPAETGAGIAALIAKFGAAIKGMALQGVVLALGAGAAAYIVMSMTLPQDNKEWKNALLVTVLSSACGGCAVVQYFELHHWFQTFTGGVAVIGIAFACGLPGWFLVRAVFIWQRQNESKSIAALLKELLAIWRGNS